MSGAWDLDDVAARQTVAQLVVATRPKACHVSLPGTASAEVQKFVCVLARHMHSKGRLCSFDLPASLIKAGAVRAFMTGSKAHVRPDAWTFVEPRLANYSLEGFALNRRPPGRR